MSKEEVVTLSVRLPTEAHRSVSVAAARANLSVSAWLARIGTMASASANAMYLVEELGSRQMPTEGVVLETAKSALDLLTQSLELSGAQNGEVVDVLTKLKGLLDSHLGAEELRGKE